ncbi:MAG: phosphohistidine phosphatase [Solirubrobacterales bacterium]|nr:phosphohistidine phosphatase [Solirubrobacterales bacterium]
MIWLLRHAHALRGAPDAERPLSDRGEADAAAAGRALAALGVSFDCCLTSPKVRALDTARLACAELGLEPEVERALADGDFDAAALAAGRGEQVLLVGHEPGMSRAIGDLTGARAEMAKGGVAAVEGRELKLLLRPAELRALARLR